MEYDFELQSKYPSHMFPSEQKIVFENIPLTFPLKDLGCRKVEAICCFHVRRPMGCYYEQVIFTLFNADSLEHYLIMRDRIYSRIQKWEDNELM